MRELGEHVEQGEEVGQPEVVSGDGGVLRTVQASLVHIAASGDTLEMGADIGSAVHPAIVTERGVMRGVLRCYAALTEQRGQAWTCRDT